MAKYLTFLITVTLSLQGYAQIDYDKGYFIDNSDQRVDCLIRNLDWGITPSEFIYKLSEYGETEKGTLISIKEFGIINDSKFIRKTVSIDRFSEDFNYLTYNENPLFQEEKLFLKVLIEGKASLYEYGNTGLKRFFYTIDNSNVEQLVYKSYKVERDLVTKNNMYKQQLLNSLNCSTFTVEKFEKLEYSANALARLFIDYNKCHEVDILILENLKKRVHLRLVSDQVLGVPACQFTIQV